MSEVKSAWGFQSDNDESLKSKQGGKFGLNNANITVLQFNPNAGKDGSAAEAVDITVSIGDKEFRSRIYDITGDLYKGDTMISPDDPGYNAVYNAEKAQREAVIVHAVKALGATEQQIQAALVAGNVSNFATWATAMCGIKPANFATLPVDVFVEWQWNIGSDNDRTFLQLPKNMKGGRFLNPGVPPVGKWNETVDSSGLRYVDDANNEHPFTRSENYMQSNKAKQQIEGEEEEVMPAMAGAAAAGPAKSKW